MTEQKCQEWSVKMWISSIDIMKAFAQPYMERVKTFGIEREYINLLERLQRRKSNSRD